MPNLSASDFEELRTGPAPPKVPRLHLSASDFEPVAPADLDLRRRIAAEKGGLEQPAIDPAWVLADMLTAGGASLGAGLGTAARAALRAGTESAVYQKLADIGQRLAGRVTTNPYIQFAAGVAVPTLTGALLRRPPMGAKVSEPITLHDFEEVSAPEAHPSEPKPRDIEAVVKDTTSKLPTQSEAIKDTVKSIPTKLSHTWGKLSDELKAWIAPETRGPEAASTARIIRSHAAENRAAALAEEFGIRPELKGSPVSETLAGFKSYFRRLPLQERWNFILKIQQGKIDELPELLQPLARIMRRGFDETYKRINKIKEGVLSYRENYFSQLWKDPEKAKAVFSSTPAMAGGRSLEGSKRFMRMRKYPTIADGLAAGLEPRFDNPIDLYLAGLYEQRRFIMGQRILQALKNEGLVKFYRIGKAPPGWTRINDKIAAVHQYVPQEKGYILRGYWMAPEPAARVINNFLSPSLRSRSALFRAWDTPISALNTFRVGFSLFHATLESVNDMAVGAGRGIGQAIGALFSGDPARALRALKEIGERGTPLGVYNDYVAGSKISHALFEPGSEGEQFDHVVKRVIRAGGSFGPQQYDSMARSFAEAAEEVGLFNTPRWLLHQTGRPIMEFLVPRIKLGAFFRLSESALSDAEFRKGAPLTLAEETAILQRTWDYVDNVFGQLVRDNLFMTNGMKDMLRLFISFPGWNIGSGRIIAGVLRGATRIGRGLPDADRNALEFAAGLLMTTAIYHSLLQYAMTGQWPRDWRDVIIGARTGKLKPDGTPERIRLPSYLRDAIGLRYHPWLTVRSKLSPAIQVISDLLSNENYWGNEIYNPKDPIYVQAKQIGEYLSQYTTPFSIQAARQAQEPQAEVLSLFGITPVPSWLAETPARALLYQYAKQARGSLTPEQAETSRERVQLRQMLRKGDIKGFRAEVARARERWLTKHGLQSLLRTAKEPLGLEIFKHLTLEQAIRVYSLANPQERKEWGAALMHKWQRADPLEKARNLRAFQALFKASIPTSAATGTDG